MTNVAKRNRFTIIKMEREETQFSSLILPQHCACLKVGSSYLLYRCAMYGIFFKHYDKRVSRVMFNNFTDISKTNNYLSPQIIELKTKP
jgi:hypothetical protein